MSTYVCCLSWSVETDCYNTAATRAVIWQVPGEAANGTANVYTELYEGELLAKWRANSKAIAAVLSTPLMIEYKKEPWEIALITVMIGLTVACTVIPLAQAALPAVGAVTGTMIALRCIPGPSLIPYGKLKRCCVMPYYLHIVAVYGPLNREVIGTGRALQ